MELVYFWVREYKNIKNQGFNFSGKWEFEYDEDKDLLSFKELENPTPDFFFGDNIVNVTGIVGRNGSGKSSLIECIMQDLYQGIEDRRKPESKYGSVEKIEVYIANNKFIVIKNNLTPHFEMISNSCKLNRMPQKGNLINHESPIANPIIYFKPNDLPQSFPDNKNYNRKADLCDLTNSSLIEYYSKSKTQYSYGNYAGSLLESLFLGNLESSINFISSDRSSKKPVSDLKEFYFVPKKIKVIVEIGDFKKYSWINTFTENTLNAVKILANISDNYSNIWVKAEKTKKKHPEIVFLSIQGNILTQICFRLSKLLTEGTYDQNQNRKKLKNAEQILQNVSFSVNSNSVNLKKNIKTTEYFRIVKELLKVYEIYSQFILEESSYKGIETFFSKIEKLIGLFRPTSKSSNNIFDKTSTLIEKERYSIFVDLENLNLVNKIVDLYRSTFHIFSSEVFSIDWEYALSDGEKSLLELLARFTIFEDKIEKFGKNIIVILDEPDLSFHPEWQRKFLSIIIKFFEVHPLFREKKIQIIFTTHSPYILSDLPRNNVIVMKNRETKDNQKEVKKQEGKLSKTFGANIHELLADEFFMENTIGEFAYQKIKEVIELIQENKTGGREEEINFIIKNIGEPIIANKLRSMYLDLKFKDERQRLEYERSVIDERLAKLHKSNNNNL